MKKYMIVLEKKIHSKKGKKEVTSFFKMTIRLITVSSLDTK